MEEAGKNNIKEIKMVKMMKELKKLQINPKGLKCFLKEC